MTYDSELIKLLSLDIPEENPREIGFLEISGMSHYENVNSRIYAYFLNQKNFLSLADVFKNSLTDLIYEKTEKRIELGIYNVNTEELTKKGNRIDITLHNSETRNAILIENKIYHYLNNDLQDYWSHFEYSDEKQLGVLLTLYEHEVPELNKDQFVNITHLEWTSRIKSSGLPHDLPDKIYTYLNDFFRTVAYLTKTSHMNEQAKFYFQHASKVLKAKQTYDDANTFLVDQMNVLASKLGWETFGNEIGWRNIWDKKNNCDTFYTIDYTKLINGEFKVTIIIEMIREDQKKAIDLENILKNEFIDHKLKKGTNAKTYLQFAIKEYELTLDEVSYLADTLLTNINKDFESLMSKILAHFYTNKHPL